MSNSPYPTKAQIREMIEPFARGDVAGFFEHVADDVDWFVTGTSILSGRYNKATFLNECMPRVNGALDGPVKLRVTSVIGGEFEEWAVVELAGDGKCKNGMPYRNTYSWSTRWKDGKIVAVREYLDDLLLNRAILENQTTS